MTTGKTTYVCDQDCFTTSLEQFESDRAESTTLAKWVALSLLQDGFSNEVIWETLDRLLPNAAKRRAMQSAREFRISRKFSQSTARMNVPLEAIPLMAKAEPIAENLRGRAQRRLANRQWA